MLNNFNTSFFLKKMSHSKCQTGKPTDFVHLSKGIKVKKFRKKFHFFFKILEIFLTEKLCEESYFYFQSFSKVKSERSNSKVKIF